MATGYALPPPAPLEIHDSNASEKWKRFMLAWRNYALATELTEKSEAVQVATLLTVIWEEAREVYSTFGGWENNEDQNKIEPVLNKFAAYCQPRKNVPFERYRFNQRESYEHYRTALQKLAESCDFDTITPEEILRDRLVFSIRDTKVKERLLWESGLTPAKTDQICRAAESMITQMKIVKDAETDVNKVDTVNASSNKRANNKINRRRQRGQGQRKQCENCGYHHSANRESCPAFGKDCRRCGAKNHFASKCRQDIKATEEADELTEET